MEAAAAAAALTTTAASSPSRALTVTGGSPFKVPPPRKKAQVLEEDDYVDALDHIITRDFFPDLPRLRLQEQLLEAQRLDDHAQVLHLRAQLHRLRTASPSPAPYSPSASPARLLSPAPASSSTGAVPSSCTPLLGTSSHPGTSAGAGNSSSSSNKNGEEGAEEGKGGKWAGMGLDGFLRGHTSEDNASFEELVEEANARKREKYRWLYGEEERVQARLAARDDATQRLLLEPPTTSDLLLPPPRPSASLDEAPYRVANTLMYLPSSAPLSAKEEQEAARAPPKLLVHDNTRLPRNFNQRAPPRQEDNGQPQAAWAMLDAGEQELLEQRRQLRESGGLKSYDLDALRATPGREPPSPQVRGYGFVLTPSPAPHESPIMTWGKVDSTPQLMNDLDDLPVDLSPGPSFQMPKETHREQVAQRLSDKASQSARKRKRESVNNATLRVLMSPSPKRPTTPALSPAAQRLVAQKLGSTSHHLSSALLPDRQLRQSYSTPSPLRRASTPGSVSTPRTASSLRSTPSKLIVASPLVRPAAAASSTPTAPASREPQQKSLTDDLLNI